MIWTFSKNNDCQILTHIFEISIPLIPYVAPFRFLCSQEHIQINGILHNIVQMNIIVYKKSGMFAFSKGEFVIYVNSIVWLNINPHFTKNKSLNWSGVMWYTMIKHLLHSYIQLLFCENVLLVAYLIHNITMTLNKANRKVLLTNPHSTNQILSLIMDYFLFWPLQSLQSKLRCPLFISK